MSKPFYAVIIPLGEGPVDPGFGRPGGGWGGGPRPDQGLPGGQGGHPSQPIYHPGHPDHGLPAFPDQGLPGGGQGGRPDQGLPPFPSQGLPGGSGGQPSHPIHIPGVPDQGLPEGQPIPDNELPAPIVPPEYEDDLIIGVKQPGSTEWTFTAYDTSNQPDQGLPPAPTPHQRRR